jgi:ElaB/YqjD/DUF883 family membrane-anchored ribosome-binding protein
MTPSSSGTPGASIQGSARNYAHDALDDAQDKLHEMRHAVDPMVDKLASSAQKLARQSMDMANQAKQKAQDSLSRYAEVTTKYVADQPVRSVLIAAAVGAAVALLVSSARNHKRY